MLPFSVAIPLSLCVKFPSTSITYPVWPRHNFFSNKFLYYVLDLCEICGVLKKLPWTLLFQTGRYKLVDHFVCDQPFWLRNLFWINRWKFLLVEIISNWTIIAVDRINQIRPFRDTLDPLGTHKWLIIFAPHKSDQPINHFNVSLRGLRMVGHR